MDGARIPIETHLRTNRPIPRQPMPTVPRSWLYKLLRRTARKAR
jgi:hypothetical protein